MATIDATGSLQAGAAATAFATGLTWPPIQPIAIDDPTDTDPTAAYPLREPVRVIDLIGASSPTLSAENRVAEYIDSRTKTLRTLLNQLVQLMNLLPYYFLDRDGSAETPATYMRRDLDMGGSRIVDLANGASAQDLATYRQYKDVLFRVQDQIEQQLAQTYLRRDGATPMADDLNLGLNRVINLLTPPTAPAHAQPKQHFDTQITAITNAYMQRAGTPGMTGSLSFGGTFALRNLGDPTVATDLINLKYLTEQVEANSGHDVPIGMVFPWCGSAAIPPHFLVCDGRELLRTADPLQPSVTPYPFLFFAIGTAYGTPSSSNVFKLPDLRGRVPIGLDNMGAPALAPAGRVTDPNGSILGGKLGEETHVLTLAEMEQHHHTFDDAYSAHGTGGTYPGVTAANTGHTFNQTTRTTSSTGGGAAHNNVQPSMALKFIIRAT